MSGRILLDGKDIWSKPSEISKIRFRVGLVMQYPEHQLFDETVLSDIAFGPKNQGLSDAEISERVREATEFTGLSEELLSKSPFELSGGQKRRVAIAGILAMRPEVLVLDEPAAGLDPKGRREILGGLCEYVRKTGITLILVSHSMEDMAHYCDNVVVMNESEVFASGTVDEIFSRARDLERIGLNVPVISKICEGLKSCGVPMEGKLYTVDGAEAAIIKLLGGEWK
jgi:energy-coupling factor transport system ATP-binding protein